MKLFMLVFLMFGALNAASVYYKDSKGAWHLCSGSCEIKGKALFVTPIAAGTGVKYSCRVNGRINDCNEHRLAGQTIVDSYWEQVLIIVVVLMYLSMFVFPISNNQS